MKDGVKDGRTKERKDGVKDDIKDGVKDGRTKERKNGTTGGRTT